MPPTLALPRIAHRKATLANGLDVIVRRQAGVPLVAVNLWYHVGSKNEERRQRGFAHLFEHLMFEGSEHHPGDFFKPLQRLGGSVNGSTSSDRTNYIVDLPSPHLELALAMESDRMGFLLPALTEEKLRIQKGVVQNEYRQNYANRPYGQVSRLAAEAMYPPSHPYNWPTIGAMEDVEAATRADVEAFFRRFYVPANASLCLVGDLDEDEALALADRYFGGLPGGAPALPPPAPDPTLPGDRFLRLREPVELDRIHLTWHTVPQFHPDDAPLALLSDLLTRGRSSRLHRRLVLEEQVAQDVSSYHWSRELAGTFTAVATLRPGRDWRRAREAVDQAITELARDVDPAELDRVKTGRLGAFLYALDHIGGFGGIADRLNAYNVFLGDPGRITSDFDRFQAVTPDDIRRVASTYLARESAGTPRLELLVEGRSSSPVTAPAPDRATPPAAAPAGRFRAPEPQILRLSCGAELWAIPRRDLPVVAGTLVVRGGASCHGPEQGGLAQMTAAMLDEGTISRSGPAIALAAESIATSLSASCGWDGSYIGFRCLAPHLEPTLELAVDLLLNPTFPAEEWDRVRGQTLAHHRAELDRADSRAYRAFLRSLYGPAHPYGLPADGSAETIESLDLDHLRSFHAARYRPDQAAWVVAGDIDPDQLAHRLDQLLSGWVGQAGPPPAIEAPPVAPRRRIVVAHRPGAPQAAVRVGQVGIPRHDPDHLDLVVLNQILGGQFISRLNSRIREEKGLTYGIRSSFDTRRGAGPFAVASSIQADRVAEAIADVVHEVEALLGDRPPSPAELEDARRSLIDGQARQFETPSELVSRFAGLFLHGLPPDHHATLADRLAVVGPDSVVSAGARHLRPWALTAVVVADADQVSGPLQALGWAPVEIDRAGLRA